MFGILRLYRIRLELGHVCLEFIIRLLHMNRLMVGLGLDLRGDARIQLTHIGCDSRRKIGVGQSNYIIDRGDKRGAQCGGQGKYIMAREKRALTKHS